VEVLCGVVWAAVAALRSSSGTPLRYGLNSFSGLGQLCSFVALLCSIALGKLSVRLLVGLVQLCGTSLWVNLDAFLQQFWYNFAAQL
jgi:hypothetical protein